METILGPESVTDAVADVEKREDSHSDYALRRMRVADLNDDDKPREKALKSGIESLSNAELLAIILGGGIPGKSVLDLSREMLSQSANSLNGLSRMTIKEMCRRFKGVGTAKAVAVAAALELGGRCRDEMPLRQTIVRSSSDAYRYVIANCNRLQTKIQEEFWVLFLARNNAIKSSECIGVGSTNATIVDIKVIMKKSLDNLAEGIILVHNHPSGNLNPSRQDDELTTRIQAAASMLDIKLLDHLIIAGGKYYSYNDNGRL